MRDNLIAQDKNHRQLALDPAQSFIVQAPAGSGKTELLIQRFLVLLANVNSPEEILAITFTKKAAHEMRARIIHALKQATLPEPESEHAKKTWRLAKKVLEQDIKFTWHLMTNPNQLRIQTIDSFCSYLTKQLPILSHFGSQPEISDHPFYLYEEAVKEVLLHLEENVEWSTSISQLLTHLDNDLNKLHDLIVQLLTKRDQWLPYIHLNSSDIEVKTELERHLCLIISDRLQYIRSIFPHDKVVDLISAYQYASSNLKNQIQFEHLPGTAPSDSLAWKAIGQLLLTKDMTWRKLVNKNIGFPPLDEFKNKEEKAAHKAIREQFLTLIDSIRESEDLRFAFETILLLPDPTLSDDQWNILQSILHILKIAAAQLRVVFQQHGKIDFIENVQAALTALGYDNHPTDLSLSLDYQIKHILVDEFQDTSFTQFQLLEKLVIGWQPNDGHSLFVVGDPMQSIYRFRQAEVGLFLRMREIGIGNIKLTPLTLSLNFRSTHSIVEWNNDHFNQIFPSFVDMAAGAVPFTASVSNQSEQAVSQSIHINGYLGSNEKTQANQTVKIICEAQKNFSNENIAILVRSRSHLSSIIPALKQAGIPYRAIDIDPLAEKQCIIDLLTLTRALLHPADRISWLALLRAPWCGLSLNDLLAISGDNQFTTIWERINQPSVFAQLSEEGQHRLGKIIPIIKSAINSRERYNIRFWIEHTWVLLGGPACVSDSLDLGDCQAFFDLLNEFHQQHPGMPISKLTERMSSLFSTTSHDPNAVQIMTIHTAKGLEFDTVIIPHLERSMPHDDKPLFTWMEQPLKDNKTALLIAPINGIGMNEDPLYQFIIRQQKIKSDYEVERLFYVATTRAKKRLHLLFNATFTEKDSLSTGPGSFLKRLWPVIETNKESMISPSDNLEENHNQPIRLLRRTKTSWKNPITTNNFEHSTLHHQQKGFQLNDTTPKLVGIIIHRILQDISHHGINWWKNLSTDHQSDIIQIRLKRSGIFSNQLEQAHQVIQSAIQKTLNDERGQWILQTHSHAKSEYSVSTMIDGKPTNLIVDRTFIDDQNIRWIIDYKTSTFSHSDVDSFMEEELNKYKEKLTQYKNAFESLDNYPVRLGLYFPLIPAWKELVS